MIVKLQFESEDENSAYDAGTKESAIRGRLGDSVIRAIDKAMKGATWKKSGDSWIAMR